MKKKIDTKTEKSNKRWSDIDIEFVQEWYGKVKTDSIAKVLDRSPIAVWQVCKTNGFKLGERIYSANPIECLYNGKEYHLLTPFRYTRKENGATVDKTLAPKKIGRPRKHYTINQETKTCQFMGQKRKVEQKLKPNNKEQIVKVPEFSIPEGKKLTKVAPGLYKYL